MSNVNLGVSLHPLTLVSGEAACTLSRSSSDCW